MSLVTVIKISHTFTGKPIFDEIGFHVEPGDRMGLVGPNGCGKTTLLRLLTGEFTPDSGERIVAQGVRFGYLPQDVHETLSGPLLKAVVDSVPGRVFLIRELKEVEGALKNEKNELKQAKFAERLTEIHNDINQVESEFPRHKAEKILVGLGFKTSDFTKTLSALSGGWKMRAALAGLLYQNPDLLLLDEPTNHLDIPSIRWLEHFLQGFKGAMVLISHDREFLNRQVNRIISFEPEGLRTYSGNYDFYLKAREEERRSLEAKARNREQKIKEAQKFVTRFRAKATKARQAQSKIKLINKMDFIETHQRKKTISFSFPEVSRSGRVAVSMEGVSKGFGGPPLYERMDLTVLRGERIAIIGPNGSGKTSLLRMVAGEIETDEGKITLGHGVNLSYFAQHHSEMLDPGKTVIQEVYRCVPDETVGFIRSVCSAFLFSGEDVDKTVGVLSGGEKARVSLAKLLVKPGNLMVMDEPTNHLDISSSEILINALKKYNGTLLFVSHNHSFINTLATKIWDIDNGRVAEYPGNLAEYFDHVEQVETERKSTQNEEEPKDDVQPKESSGKKRQNRKAQKRERAEQRRLIYETLKPIKAELEKLESQIFELELRQKELEKILADPGIFSDKEKGVPLLKEYNEIKAEVDAFFFKWEQEQEKLESTKKKLGIE